MVKIYDKLKEFKIKYPWTVAWRLRRHAEIAEKHVNPGEKVLYAFAGQKNDTHLEFFRTFAVVLTNQRILLAQKRLFFGYLFLAITPDMFNDLTVNSGVLWGSINIDTIKETVVITNIQKSALPEIETAITEYMMKEKKRYKLERKEPKK